MLNLSNHFALIIAYTEVKVLRNANQLTKFGRNWYTLNTTGTCGRVEASRGPENTG